MFYITEITDHVRVEPELFGLPIKEAIKTQLEKYYEDSNDEKLGAVITVLEVTRTGDGILIPEDSAAYYDSTFRLLTFKPYLQELVYAKVSQITNFGAFMDMGLMEAMIHITQTMDDYVNFSKTNALIGKNSKKSLKKNDLCIARVVAMSKKGGSQKIGLTMRQPGLGKIEWISDDKKRSIALAKQMEKKEKKKK
ncbi:MAG: DNA-directed RNA polymerase [archaeon]